MWSLFWPRRPREKFSLDNLRYLYEELTAHDVVDESNKDVVVEILRSIAELMIWGDQHNDNVFYFFCEKNILGHFLRILSLPLDRQITVQILQTLSIMIQNFNRQTSVFYLLSNNHINALILHRFDFGDEEVIAYYISFLKTLSLKLNRETLQFFFNRDDGAFPLYAQAIQFFHHSEAMVRIAVRTITLNVFRVDDPDLRRFIVDVSAAPYFSNLVWFIRNQISEVDAMLQQQAAPHQQMTRLLDIQIDQFHYIMDILRLEIDALNRVLVQQLLANFIRPVLLQSLVNPSAVALSPRLSLFVLFQIFLIFTDKRLVNTTALFLLRPSPQSPGGAYDELVFESDGDVVARPELLHFLSRPDLAQFAAALLLAILRNPEIDTNLLMAVSFCPQRTLKKRRLLTSLLSDPARTPLPPTLEPVPRMRQLSDALQAAQSDATYAEDVVDACFKLLSNEPHQESVHLIALLLTELVHVERGGLNRRHSEFLLNAYEGARRRLPNRCVLLAEKRPSATLVLAAFSEPTAILPASSLLSDSVFTLTLHRLITSLTTIAIEAPDASPVPV